MVDTCHKKHSSLIVCGGLNSVRPVLLLRCAASLPAPYKITHFLLDKCLQRTASTILWEISSAHGRGSALNSRSSSIPFTLHRPTPPLPLFRHVMGPA